MWGVVGVETGYGENISTSSAGAMGLYQFTAAIKPGARLAYPMTNSHDVGVLARQALAAGGYLHALYDELGHDWTRAMAGYNAGPGNWQAGVGYAHAATTASGAKGPGLQVRSSSAHPVGDLLRGAKMKPPTLPSPRTITGHVLAGGVVVPTERQHDYSPKVQHTGKLAGTHGSTIQRVNVGLSGLPARYRR
jgi:hypothetical protein